MMMMMMMMIMIIIITVVIVVVDDKPSKPKILRKHCMLYNFKLKYTPTRFYILKYADN